jgi:hypothetical protein
MMKAKLMKQDSLNWTQSKKQYATPLSSQLIICKELGTTTTAMSRRGHSTLVIWSSVASKMKQGYISLTRDRKGPSVFRRSQGQVRINYSTLMARRS